jgi:RNA polymerase sigma-70 factor (ECF subfamily)
LNFFRWRATYSSSMTDRADRMYEQLLVLRCQARDEHAFAELVERYAPRLRLYLRKMLGPRHAIEDVLQDVWFDVFRGLHKLLAPEALSAWLYSIAHARACRLLRRRAPVRLQPGSPEPFDEAEDDFGPEDAAAIHAALDLLTPEHREVLLLRFVEQMSYEQIAQVVACGVGTVRSRIHYAKRALRAALENNSYERK